MSFNEQSRVNLCRLYRKTSKSGNTYFCGRLSFGANVLLFKNERATEDKGSDGEIWDLVIQARPPENGHRPKNESATVNTAQKQQNYQRAQVPIEQELSDEIPF